MPHSIEGYEQSIPLTQRVLNGQYYTPAFLCDLILALCMPNRDCCLLEPSCGTGVFLQRAMDRFTTLNSVEFPSAQMHAHGIELDAQAAEFAVDFINQTLLNHAGTNLSGHIQTDNFLSSTITQNSVGLFDCIVGNPPYVRQEHLAQQGGALDQPIEKQAIIAHLHRAYADYVSAFPAQLTLFSQTADLYIWFFLQATTLLKPGGTLAFITSNSWLNAAYGHAFRQFLTHHFHIRYLVESACERWFPDAAINAIITVLEKKTKPNDASTSDQLIQVVRFHSPLPTWLPDSTSPTYWRQLHQQIHQLNRDSHIEHKHMDPKSLENHRHNWALPLRAPTALTHLLEQSACWLRLDEVGRVRYPIKTGINPFFYLSKAQAAQWQLEPEFLFPVIRSARKIQRYALHTADCDERLFACPLTKEQLLQSRKTGALAYITWGEQQSAPPRQKRTQPIPWPQVPSVRSNQPGWYTIQPIPPAHILCNRFTDRRFFFALCQGDMIEDQTFYGLTLTDPNATPPAFIAALLNSTLSYALLEFNGRTGLGEGVLQFSRGDMAALPVLNPALFSVAEQQALADHFFSMSQRRILPLPDEIQQADRLELDRLVLTPLMRQLGLTDTVEMFREQWMLPLLNRMAERQTLARCFRKKHAKTIESPTLR